MLVFFNRRHAPDWLIIENSDMLVKDVADMNELTSALGAAGYRIVPCLLDSSEFGVPVHRRRSYFLACLVSSTAVKRWNMEAFGAGLTEARRMPPCLSTCLLEDTHPLVKQSLERRLENFKE